MALFIPRESLPPPRHSCINKPIAFGQSLYRVWPDYTVQECEDQDEPYSHKSDDWVLVWAFDHGDAENIYRAWEKRQ